LAPARRLQGATEPSTKVPAINAAINLFISGSSAILARCVSTADTRQSKPSQVSRVGADLALRY